MVNKKIVRKAHEYYKSTYIDEIVESDKDYFYTYSQVNYEDDEPYWNNLVCFPGRNLSENLTRMVEVFYTKKDRVPCIYASYNNSLDYPDEYKKLFEDVWMFEHKCDCYDTEVELDEVQNSKELSLFIDLFYKTYSSDLDDVYSGVSEAYGKQLNKKFECNYEEFDRSLYILRRKGDIVGHRIIIHDNKDAMLTTLGILPEFRGKGIGTEALIQSVKILKDKGVENIFLQTENGTENETFFDKRGFRKEFCSTGLIKKDIS